MIFCFVPCHILWFHCFNIPGHPWDEKGLQGQKGVGLLVGIQERRAFLVPLMNRLQTADEPMVNRGSIAAFISPPVYKIFVLFVLVQGCAEAYQACRGVSVPVCIQFASRNEERLSSCWSSDILGMGRVPGHAWNEKSLQSLNRISLVRAYRKTLRRRIFDAFDRAKKNCSLDEQFCW